MYKQATKCLSKMYNLDSAVVQYALYYIDGEGIPTDTT